MKKIAAFFTALILFFVTVIGIHFAVSSNLKTNSRGFGTWINTYKDLSYAAIDQNLEDDTVMMMGSSEFQHGRKTPYHPTKIFRGMDMDVMCVGAAYNQCLSHAITLGSVAPELKSKKVILILSPSWFEKEGVKKNAFAVRFSETQYMALLKNPNLSPELKKKIAERSEELLTKDPAMQENVKRYNNLFLKGKINPVDKIYFYARKAFLNEKESVNINTVWKSTGKKQYENYKKHITGEVPNWNELIVQADESFDKVSQDNPFHMRDKIYKKKFKPVLAKQKGAMAQRQFTKDSPEYGDLDLFLQVCKESNIDCELILLPMNGYWYDYTGFNEQARSVLPGQIKAVSDKYGVNLVSFYDQEYTPGFLEDAFHPAGKGWTEINEKAYEFYTKDKSKGKGSASN